MAKALEKVLMEVDIDRLWYNWRTKQFELQYTDELYTYYADAPTLKQLGEMTYDHLHEHDGNPNY